MKNYKEIHKKKIGIFLNYVAASPAVELYCSIIEDLLANKNEVHVYYCNSGFQSCLFNPIKSSILCKTCKLNVKYLIDQFPEIHAHKIDEDDLMEKMNRNIDSEIKADLLISAMSSVASLTKAVDEDDLTDFWKSTLEKMKQDAVELYYFLKKEIEFQKFNYFVCFNGRFFDSKPVIKAAQKTNISFILLEVKKSSHPLVFVDELIHSIEANTKRAIEYFSLDPLLGHKRANIFFSKKIFNEETGDPVYTRNQKRGLLPNYLDPKRRLVVVYPTTDDEYKFIGKEWDGIVPEDQVAEIKSLCSGLEQHQVVVKMHPNQADMSKKLIARYLKIEKLHKNCHVELPQSKVDTYELMKMSDVVINFASTIGVEASYYGKKVVNIGDTNFSRIGVVNTVYSGAEAAALIVNNRVQVFEKTPAAIWGNYISGYSSGLASFGRNSRGRYLFRNRVTKISVFWRFFGLFPKVLIRSRKNRMRHL